MTNIWASLLLAWLGVIAAQASPGPNLLAVAATAIGSGRRAALFVTCGVATGILAWAVAIAFGLGLVLQTTPVALIVLKLAGGLYLTWMALKGLIAAWRGAGFAVRADKSHADDTAHWRHGLLIVLTNPKAGMMWIALGSFLFGSGLSAWQVLACGPAVSLSALAIYGGYAWLFSTGFVGSRMRRFSRAVNVIFGAAFGLLGARLIVDALRAMQA